LTTNKTQPTSGHRVSEANRNFAFFTDADRDFDFDPDFDFFSSITNLTFPLMNPRPAAS